MKKWNEASVIEDQICGRSGRPKDARTNENIALLRVDSSKLRPGVNLEFGFYFIAISCVVWTL